MPESTVVVVIPRDMAEGESILEQTSVYLLEGRVSLSDAPIWLADLAKQRGEDEWSPDDFVSFCDIAVYPFEHPTAKPPSGEREDSDAERAKAMATLKSAFPDANLD